MNIDESFVCAIRYWTWVAAISRRSNEQHWILDCKHTISIIMCNTAMYKQCRVVITNRPWSLLVFYWPPTVIIVSFVFPCPLCVRAYLLPLLRSWHCLFWRYDYQESQYHIFNDVYFDILSLLFSRYFILVWSLKHVFLYIFSYFMYL